MSEQLRAGILLACSVTDVTFGESRVGLDAADGQDEVSGKRECNARDREANFRSRS